MSQTKDSSLNGLSETITTCRLCPRLVRFRETLPPRAAFRCEEYWRRPVPGFGDPDAWLMVMGLAPAAHGGNRTGRVFTGDESSRFLTRVLYRAGLANQPTSLSRNDGLQLSGCYVNAAVRCVPPGNKPTPWEFGNCIQYLERELELLQNLSAVVALGQLAFRAYLELCKRSGASVRGVEFAHGARIQFREMPWLYGSYHPSPRNTYTRKLTEGMLLDVFEKAKRDRVYAHKRLAPRRRTP